MIECTKKLDQKSNNTNKGTIKSKRKSKHKYKNISIRNLQDITIKEGFYDENRDFIEKSFSPNADLINKVMALIAKATHLDLDIQTNRHNFSISSSLANTLILQTSEELL